MSEIISSSVAPLATFNFDEPQVSVEKAQGAEAIVIGGKHMLELGLAACVAKVRAVVPDTPIVVHYHGGYYSYDCVEIAKICADATVSGVIVFPYNGHVVLEQWVCELQYRSLVPVIGIEIDQWQFITTSGLFQPPQLVIDVMTGAARAGVRTYLLLRSSEHALTYMIEFLNLAIRDRSYTLYADNPGVQDGRGSFEVVHGGGLRGVKPIEMAFSPDTLYYRSP